MAAVEGTAHRGRVLVIRHAQSTWNAAGRWQGWSDAPLSEVGSAQAAEAGRALAGLGTKPQLIASSDLSRARRTAELIAVEVGYTAAIATDVDLREQDLGEWNGLTSEEILARWPEELAARREGLFGPVAGGEPGPHFTSRAVAALKRMAAAVAADGAAGIIVTHGGVVIALEQALGVWSPGKRHSNLSGWWVAASEAPHGVELRALTQLDLLHIGARTVTGRG